MAVSSLSALTVIGIRLQLQAGEGSDPMWLTASNFLRDGE
jgi:hypothetical protein